MKPTAHVDARTEALIIRGMDGILRGSTIILIAHRFSTLRRADVLAVLEAGQVAAVGSHEELLESCEAYRELWAGTAAE